MPDQGKLLIAEDERLIVRGMRLVLEDAGFLVCAVVATEAAAVEAAEQHRPDLALIDVHLADGTDGIRAATEIQRRLGIPSIVFSGIISAHEARTAGVLGFLRKPCGPDTLVQVVSEAIAWIKEGRQPVSPGLFTTMPPRRAP